MAITTPTLGGVTLPVPSEYGESNFTKGTVQRMANGALVRDLVQSGAKNRFALTFDMLTDVQKSAVRSGVATVRDGSSVTFLAPTGTSYTVVLADGGEPEWEAVSLRGTELRWRGTIELEEV